MTLSIQGTNFWMFVYTPGTVDKMNNKKLIINFDFFCNDNILQEQKYIRIRTLKYSAKSK